MRFARPHWYTLRFATRAGSMTSWRGELFKLLASGEDTKLISDDLIACNGRLIELMDLIDCHWGAMFDRKAGDMT